MHSASSRLTVLLVVLALTLAASPVFAAGGRGDRAESTAGVFATLWQALGELVPWIGEGRVAKRGSAMDPDGATASACPDERGSIMDPNGCPRSQSFSDSGSAMDPNG